MQAEQQIIMPLKNFSYSLAYQQFIVSRMHADVERHKRRNEHERADALTDHCLKIVANVICQSF